MSLHRREPYTSHLKGNGRNKIGHILYKSSLDNTIILTYLCTFSIFIYSFVSKFPIILEILKFD